MTSAEKEARRLVRAWPIPDRVERGEEIVGTTLDLVPELRSRLPLAVATNLVVGGLKARWRARPPIWWWLYYRVGGRLPLRWHRWMINDLLGPGWRRRSVEVSTVLGLAAAALGVLTASAIVHPTGHDAGFPWIWILPGTAVGTILGSWKSSQRRRDRLLARNGYLQPTDSRVAASALSGLPTRPPPIVKG